MKHFRVCYISFVFAFTLFTLNPLNIALVKAYPNLSGAWIGVNPGLNRQGPSSIEQNGNELLFISEIGTRSKGYFLDNSTNTVVASDWGNLQGTLVNNSTRINWANNTYWEKARTPSTNAYPNLSGGWIGVNPGLNRRGSSSIEQNGNELLFISEIGTRSKGYFLDNSTNTVVASDWGNLQGTLVNNNTRINWANNTYWERY